MRPVTMEIAIVVSYFIESEVDNTAPHPPGMLMCHLYNTRGRLRHGYQYQSILFDYLWYANVSPLTIHEEGSMISTKVYTQT